MMFFGTNMGRRRLRAAQFSPQARATIASRAFRPVGAVGGDFLLDGPADVHHSVDRDLGQVPTEVVLLPDLLQP